ncbi:TPA: hypothetical protein ACOEHP_000728 [Enterobacter ludwigii]|nr:hypothetical protein [Enterobacter ludwigii]
MTANKPMTGEQLDELMTVAVNMQRDAETDCNRPSAMFVYAVQVAVLELRKVRNDAAALAAENAGLKEWSPNPHSASMFEAIEKAEELMDDGMPELAMIEAFEILKMKRTPATDAFLAEVRASAIDSLVDIKTKQLADMHPDTHAFGATVMSIRSQINELNEFAAQLRKGVQS